MIIQPPNDRLQVCEVSSMLRGVRLRPDRTAGRWPRPAVAPWLAALCLLAWGQLNATSWAQAGDEQAAKDSRIVEAVMRLPNYDVQQNPQVKEAVLRYLETQRGSPRYIELVRKLKLRDAAPQLAEIALAGPATSEGVNAAELLIEFQQIERLEQALRSDQPATRQPAAEVLGRVGNVESVQLLRGVLEDSEAVPELRQLVAGALGHSNRGEQLLLRLARENRLGKEVRFVAANVLHASRNPNIKSEAAQLLPLPATADQQPLPPVADLVLRKGDVQKGKLVFDGPGSCAKCHLVAGQGKAVGPDLSEIGSKLSKDAMYVSILDPSAGISHSYETYAVILAGGTVENGLLVSETADAVTLKNAEGIDRTFAKDDVEEMLKQEISLMPADIQKTISVEQLVDLVEYLTTLTKKD